MDLSLNIPFHHHVYLVEGYIRVETTLFIPQSIVDLVLLYWYDIWNCLFEAEWNKLTYNKEYQPTFRNSHTICSDIEHKQIYLFGGRSKGGCNNDLYVLNGNKLNLGWELIDKSNGEIPSPRKNTAMCCYASRLYLFGGNNHSKTRTDAILNDFYAYDISIEQWVSLQTKGEIPSPRDRHSLTVINNKMYIFGGSSDYNNEFLNDLYMYNTKTTIWTQIYSTNKPEPRYEHCAVAIDHYLIVSSGKCINGPLFDFWLLDTSQITNMINNHKNNQNDTYLQWRKMELILPKNNANMEQLPGVKPEPRWGHSLIAFHKTLIIFGGWNGRFCFNDLSIVDFGLTSFTALRCNIRGQFGCFPSMRTFHGVGLIDNKVIICGGRNMNKRLNDTYYLDVSDLAPGAYRLRMQAITYLSDLQRIRKKKCTKHSKQNEYEMDSNIAGMDENSPELFKNGTHARLLHHGKFGKAKDRLFQLRKKYLTWSSKKKSAKETRVNLQQIRKIAVGTECEILKRKELHNDKKSFTIYYGGNNYSEKWKSLTLTAKTATEARIWINTLSRLSAL